MSAVFNVGDRVVCIPFKHKGKVGTVRFFGPVAKTFGTWVGIELEVSWIRLIDHRKPQVSAVVISKGNTCSSALKTSGLC
jgi:hypothetical protein